MSSAASLLQGRDSDSATALAGGLPLDVLKRRVGHRRHTLAIQVVSYALGATVLLVDDILTTGATARAAAQALKRAGAATVWVATLARARRIHRGTGTAQTDNTGFAESDTQGDTKSANAEEQQQQQRAPKSRP